MLKTQYLKLTEEIFNPAGNFDETALRIFQFQATDNAVYKNYIEALKINPKKIKSVNKIPFLPIQFFKLDKIITSQQPQIIFESSGTTGTERSKHYVADLKLYEKSFLKCFDLSYGNIEKYCLLALMPNGLNTNSSLVFMTSELIRRTKNSFSGFYMDEFEKLVNRIQQLQNQNQKFILFGLTYALMDFAEKYSFHIRNGIIMETGGMKGRRQEMVREELHKILRDAFGVPEIHSEYGMTELLSQAYSKGKGIFNCPPWMKVSIRDVNDPRTLIANGQTGGINIVDLANIYSCSFIATQDLGKKYDDESFEVLGRFDESDLRGCNLMIE